MCSSLSIFFKAVAALENVLVAMAVNGNANEDKAKELYHWLVCLKKKIRYRSKLSVIN